MHTSGTQLAADASLTKTNVTIYYNTWSNGGIETSCLFFFTFTQLSQILFVCHCFRTASQGLSMYVSTLVGFHVIWRVMLSFRSNEQQHQLISLIFNWVFQISKLPPTRSCTDCFCPIILIWVTVFYSKIETVEAVVQGHLLWLFIILQKLSSVALRGPVPV